MIRNITFSAELVLTVGLRGAVLVSKFILLVYLAKIFSPEQLGVYGLFAVTISFSLYVVGLDYYNYVAREIVSASPLDVTLLIRDQLVFYSITFFLALPILLIIFYADLIPWKYIFLFYAILAVEHLSMEAYRTLIVLSKPVCASIALFLRAGAWVYLIVVIMLLNPNAQKLTYVFAGWFIGALSSVLYVAYILRQLEWNLVAKFGVDWERMRRGLRVAIPFLVGTLALRGIFTIDRYVLKIYWGSKDVGVYTLFYGIASVMHSISEAAAVIRYFPKMIGSFKKKEYEDYKRFTLNMANLIVLIVVVSTVSIAIFIHPLLEYIGRLEYSQNIMQLWILMAAMVVMILAMVPHYTLYATGNDSIIVISHLLGLLAALLAAVLLIPDYAGIGAANSVLLGLCTMAVVKSIAHFYSARRYVRKEIQ